MGSPSLSSLSEDDGLNCLPMARLVGSPSLSPSFNGDGPNDSPMARLVGSPLLSFSSNVDGTDDSLAWSTRSVYTSSRSGRCHAISS